MFRVPINLIKLMRRKFFRASASTEGRRVSRIEFSAKSVLDPAERTFSVRTGTFFIPMHSIKNTRTDNVYLLRKKRVQFAVLIFLLMTMCSIHAQKAMTIPEISEFKKSVKSVAEKTLTISSDFDQYKHMEFLSNDIKTVGRMQFKAPNLVKWSYIEPFQYSVIFKEGKLLINDEGKKSDVNIGSNQLFKKLNQLIVKSINGDMFDDDEFVMNFSQTDSNTIVTFDSKNTELKKYIKQFVLHFNKQNYAVVEIKMTEPSDDYTRIVFKNRNENQTIKDEVFSN